MNKVTVIGAGVIGICCALQLRRKGFDVTLIDSDEPASQASYGNAGVICTNALAPYASPQLLPMLPAFGFNRDPRFQFHWPHFLQLLPWLTQFVKNCSQKSYERSLTALAYLTADAVQLHKEWLQDSGALHLFRDKGWLRLYRDVEGFNATGRERSIFEKFGIPYEVLNTNEIVELEPDVLKKYFSAILLPGSPSVSHPQSVCQSYFKTYLSEGGKFQINQVKDARPKSEKWIVTTESNSIETDKVVFAMGADTPNLLKPLGIRIPMAIERGYHLAYTPTSGKALSRSIIDLEKGLVMTPMETPDQKFIRVTSAVNLIAKPTTPSFYQINNLKSEINSIFPMESELLTEPWTGHRPSMPDSIPVIGPAPFHPGLWLAFGHGHLGFSLGPKTAELIANSITGEINDSRATAFLPDRFL